ncbi:Hypothetical protein GbCGDNIH2_1431 [Granulibacter bethesdensis]|uniref:Uncharacterized protein n=3 Tax=Granulibacter bethesdensis TaxID=364410 RepID=Q0BS73_GRABC|nr:Hypothetical protein GbCGDNIH1_1431 [Granulibacter bethesdensis CGDNIH1]AHJ63318.1 Hypothetical protein GbCGDNIH3_1431 [Granulibacter bethesdensis]AHJ66106.1 Hypothetical protein GbCGDNIH4_1431 [Granulibacter bethesdensis CGDNIH4]AHJ68754.1 Hypothetical protein GbCGDNIH2_1431 [Granulibacter bethesdensis]APH52157.1 Hypothetical protein GbCGDNIH5_1431 [Granulibacter bethesdensis]
MSDMAKPVSTLQIRQQARGNTMQTPDPHRDQGANNPLPAPSIRTLENPLAPEMFVAEAHGFFIHMGNVHITFATPRVDHGEESATINRAVVGRVVMPLATAQNFAVGLYDFLAQNGFTVEKPRSKDLQ